MLHFFNVRMGYERQWEEPEGRPTFNHIIAGWVAFLLSGLMGIYVGFFDAWFLKAAVIFAPLLGYCVFDAAPKLAVN